MTDIGTLITESLKWGPFIISLEGGFYTHTHSVRHNTALGSPSGGRYTVIYLVMTTV